MGKDYSAEVVVFLLSIELFSLVVKVKFFKSEPVDEVVVKGNKRVEMLGSVGHRWGEGLLGKKKKRVKS